MPYCLTVIRTPKIKYRYCSYIVFNIVIHYSIYFCHWHCMKLRGAFSALMLLAVQQEGHSACKTWVVRYWHGYLSETRCKCMWSSWCHCHPIISCSSKIWNGLSFWCRLTQFVLEKQPLNGCSVVVAVWTWSCVSWLLLIIGESMVDVDVCRSVTGPCYSVCWERSWRGRV